MPRGGAASLDVEILVVTHIDNDHILGILELLKARPAIASRTSGSTDAHSS